MSVEFYLTDWVENYIPSRMSETADLIARIRALASKTGKSTSTLSAQLLGSGASFDALENGKTITLAKYERAKAALEALERGA